MDEERKLLEKYGLKNKRELWKAQSILRGFRRQARDLQARLRAGEPQAKRETDRLLGRLTRLGVLARRDADPRRCVGAHRWRTCSTVASSGSSSVGASPRPRWRPAARSSTATSPSGTTG